MKVFQRSISFLLLVIFLHNLGGYYWVYRVLRKQAKAEMKNYIRSHYHDDEGITRFTEEQIASVRWEHKHEFEYNGNMYDVVKAENRDGKRIFHCVKDDREKELIRTFLDIRILLEDDNDEEKNRPAGQWLKKQKKEITPPRAMLLSPSALITWHKKGTYSERIIPGHSKHRFPPPKA